MPLPPPPLASVDGVDSAAWLIGCGAALAAAFARRRFAAPAPRPPVQTQAGPLGEHLARPPPPPNASPCKKCRGTANGPCLTCAGAGRLNSPGLLVLPKGERVEWCPCCRGTGLEPCPWCLGEGFKREIGFR